MHIFLSHLHVINVCIPRYALELKKARTTEGPFYKNRNYQESFQTCVSFETYISGRLFRRVELYCSVLRVSHVALR